VAGRVAEGVAGVAVAAAAAVAGGVTLGGVAMVAVVEVMASSRSNEPTTLTATTKLAMVRNRILW
jgi:hypothetical protein